MLRQKFIINHNNPAYKLKILDYTYTSQPSISNALPLKFSKIKFAFYILGIIITFGFLWLLVKWSNKRKAICLFDVCILEEATHFLIEEEEIIGGSKIVQRMNKVDIRTRRQCLSFCYHQRVYLFHEQKQAFLPIRYEQLGIHLDQLRKNIFEPYSKNLRPEMHCYYGQNIIDLPIQTKIEVFIQEMLTPYEVFQTYAIILWIAEQYYVFSFILIAYALYTYWQTSSEVVSNQKKLAQQSYFEIRCKVLVNQNDNIGAINFNDQAQIQKISFISTENDKRDSINSSKKNQMVQEQIEPQVEVMTKIIRKPSFSNFSQEGYIFDKKKIKSIQVSSKQILPGDLLILHEGDTIPCDCILLKGEILVDQSYVTGEQYLTRKIQLENFTFTRENQNNFTLYLGTKIVKIKGNSTQIKPESQKLVSVNSIESSIMRNQFTLPNQIICLVINTNYNTLRGKYLRAIRHQKKQPQSFTRQTIYFIYILIFITTIVFGALFSILKQGLGKWDLFILYLDMLSTSIPPTLPTLLSVGINFAQHRLKGYNISCVLPSNILAGGRVDTIILQGHHALGKQYEVESMMIGMKNGTGFGQTYSSVQKFYNYYEQPLLETSSSSVEQLSKKQSQRKDQLSFGEFFINAISTCHDLEYFEEKIEGKTIQKKIFEFSECQISNENIFLGKNKKMTLEKKIYFKEKQKKMAVIVNVENYLKTEKQLSQRSIKNQLEHYSLLDEEGDDGLLANGTNFKTKQYQSQGLTEINKFKRVIFLKGSPQKILNHCISNSYPSNTFDYIVDMAQKGFNLICYAYMPLIDDEVNKSNNYYMKEIRKNKFTFLGFLILKQIRYQDNIQAIQSFKKADIDVLLVSEQRELQTSSIAILNKICEKKQLLLCSFAKNKNKIYCKGHVEWQSSLPDPLPEFVTEFQDFGKNSSLSLTSQLYEEMFMRRDSQAHSKVFSSAIIFNQMQYRHERNLYSQLQKKQRVSFAVGGGGIVSECANLSMQLERNQSSLLSSFYTKSKSLMTIFHCLRICRAGLATNFHVFSMMILFSMIQFTTVCLLYSTYQELSDSQMLYEDLFVTFPIFVALNLTKPSSKLSKQRPMNSFFDTKALASMIGQLILQFFAQLAFLLYLLTFDEFTRQKQKARIFFLKSNNLTQRSVTVNAIFVLSNYLYLGIVLSTSVSKPFRKPFYTNPWYTLILVLLWIYNTLVVLAPSITAESIRATGLSINQEQIVILAMIYGNLMMVLMYLYENLVGWIWRKYKKYKKNQLKREDASQTIQMSYK